MLNNIKNLKNDKGFTIVELLIVIVVIAILAAITIVAYNGIQTRANASSAKAAATTAIKKAEAYNADLGTPTSAYPVLPSHLTAAASTTTYTLSGSNITFATGTGGTTPNFTTAPTTVPATNSTLIWYTCDSGAGFRVAYWDYESSATNKWTNLSTGTTTSCTFKSVGATV